MTNPSSHSESATTVETLIDQLLADQRRFTAVERFAQKHAQGEVPGLQSHYRDLIPLSTPRPGEQFAFEVDLDRCSGCKGCVTACHALNGLDEDESWRAVGFLVGEAILPLPGKPPTPADSPLASGVYRPTPGNRVIPLQQVVTTACHHCAEPACLFGCPVLAYDKDPVTGIVRHLDDQCIGCSYCILKCPYEVPQYSVKRGIVRKCDMCHGRLAEGEAPACVQACPNEAIRITTVVRSALVTALGQSRGQGQTAGAVWLPDAPAPDYTLPTTRYLSARPNTELKAANHFQVHPSSPHWPLVFMLVWTQVGMGLLIAGTICGRNGRAPASWLALIGYGSFFAGLGASVLHLGQPKKAWRVWLGWRTSWLSREAIALNLLAGLMTPLFPFVTAPVWLPSVTLPGFLTMLFPYYQGLPTGLVPLVLTLATLPAVFAQAMVYADTRRRFWRLATTAPRFLGTTIVTGLAGALAITGSPTIAAALLATTLIKLGVEVSVLKHAESDHVPDLELRRSAILQWGVLRPLWATRLVLGLSGGVLIPLAVVLGVTSLDWVIAGAVILMLGELAERCLFFSAVAPNRMPGQPQ